MLSTGGMQSRASWTSEMLGRRPLEVAKRIYADVDGVDPTFTGKSDDELLT